MPDRASPANPLAGERRGPHGGHVKSRDSAPTQRGAHSASQAATRGISAVEGLAFGVRKGSGEVFRARTPDAGASPRHRMSSVHGERCSDQTSGFFSFTKARCSSVRRPLFITEKKGHRAFIHGVGVACVLLGYDVLSVFHGGHAAAQVCSSLLSMPLSVCISILPRSFSPVRPGASLPSAAPPPGRPHRAAAHRTD